MKIGFFEILILLVVIPLIIMLIRWPVRIAKQRNLPDGTISTIGVLSWLGIFMGITWVIALFVALMAMPETMETKNINPDEDIDKLAKLHKLKKSGAITATEFEKQKKKILK
jgi:uncharacterized membrane protein